MGKSLIIVFLSLCMGALVLRPEVSYSQDSIIQKKEYNNSIKTIATVIPLILFNEFSISVGYERKLSPKSYIGIQGYYLFFMSEMGDEIRKYSILPEYDYYINADSHKGPYFKIGCYLSFINESSDEDWGSGVYSFGAGLVPGMRINISKNHRFFMDIAFGVSYNYSVEYNTYTTLNESLWRLIPRPIIHFGYRF